MKRETNKDSFVLIQYIDCYRLLLAVSLFQVLTFFTNLLLSIMNIFYFLKTSEVHLGLGR